MIDRALSSGASGATFVHVGDSANYIVKVYVSEYNATYEWDCVGCIYKALKTHLPASHIVRPIDYWKCKYEELDPIVQEVADCVDHNFAMVCKKFARTKRLNGFFYVNVLSNLGDYDLRDFIDRKVTRSVRTYVEIMFQLILYLIQLIKYTDLLHNDVKANNIVVKANERIVRMGKYRFRPSYIAYFIDFGLCTPKEKHGSRGVDMWDFNNLWKIFDYFPRECVRFANANEKRVGKMTTVEQIEALLDDRLFKKYIKISK